MNQGKMQELGQGRAGADEGKGGVKESLSLTNFLSYVFTSITTSVVQLQLVFSLPSVHRYPSQGLAKYPMARCRSLPCPLLSFTLSR